MHARCSKFDFRNLGIIWGRNRWSDFFAETFFVDRKKSWDQNFSIFCRKKINEQIYENSNFWDFENFSKSQNFEFSLIFSSIFFPTKNRKFLVPKKFGKIFDRFFRRKIFRWKKSVHIFRCQMIPRFQKSHLENCRRKLKPSFCPISILYTIFFTNFEGTLGSGSPPGDMLWATPSAFWLSPRPSERVMRNSGSACYASD